MDAWQIDELETEAFARITWGDSPAEVRRWLRSSALEDFYVDAVMRDCLQRRAADMRQLGVRNLVRGAGALSVAVIAGSSGWLLSDWLASGGVRISALLYVVTFSPGALVFGYGVWQAWLAFDRLVFGARADGAVRDVE